MLLLKNCKLLPFLTEGTSLTEADVLVRDGKIERLLPLNANVEAETVLDLCGKALMPGLIDMHTHLAMVNADETFGCWGKISAPKFTINAIRYAQYYLNSGYTTVRDCGDMIYNDVRHVRNAINKGELVGPRIHTSGPILETRWEGNDPLSTDMTMALRADGPIGFRRAARQLLGEGFDFVKMYGSGSLLFASKEPGYPVIEADEIREAVRVAELTGSYTAIHAHGATAIDTAVRCGVHTIEHASMITEETLRHMEEHFPDNGLVPTLYASDEIMCDPNSYNGQRMCRLFPTIQASLQNAYTHRDKLLIGWGTDVPLETFMEDPMLEFKLRKEKLEYSNEEILKQATINSAKLMGLDDVIGTVREGKEADLIVVDGDPADDISVMYQIPAHVIRSGKLIR